MAKPIRILDNSGSPMWYLGDRLHREDGPAVEWIDGGREWRVHGKRHRVGGPAIVTATEEFWYQKGKLHREDGPAIITNKGYGEWYQKGKLHREDGPAIEFTSGNKGWYLNGSKYEPMEWMLKVHELGLK